jgi:hypothetical protein
MSKIVLRLYSLLGCQACDELEGLLSDVLLNSEFGSIDFLRVYVTTNHPKDEYGVMPSAFPTLVAFVGSSPVMGWEGLADTPSRELKRQIIQSEMAKLLDRVTASDSDVLESNRCKS